jgi:hypothetical protein
MVYKAMSHVTLSRMRELCPTTTVVASYFLNLPGITMGGATGSLLLIICEYA